MHPRTWNPVKTCFEPDNKRLGGKKPRFTLGSPNFKKIGQVPVRPGQIADVVEDDSAAEPVVELVPAEGFETSAEETPPMPPDAEGYELALLRFFRDLYENERLKILVELDAIPAESNERINQGLERRLFDWLAREGRLPDLILMIDRLIGERDERDA